MQPATIQDVLRSCLVIPKFDKLFPRGQPKPVQRRDFQRGFFLYFIFLTTMKNITMTICQRTGKCKPLLTICHTSLAL